MPPGIEPGEPDPIDDLIRSAGVRRRPSAMDEPDPIDDLIQSAGIRRRPSALDALDAGEAESGSRLMDSAAPSENVLQAQGWARAISVAIAVLAMAGLLTDTVAASQLLADSGPGALAVVWPLGAIGMLVVAALLMKYVDRFPRLSVLVVLCVGYGVAFAITLALFATPLPRSVPAALVWLLADQLIFLLPLVIWSLAGDVFTAGQATKISLWMFVGQFIGLVIATTSPWWFEPLGLDLTWLLLIPSVACLAVAALLPRALRSSSASAGHGQSMSIVAAVRDTTELVRDLPAFSWLLKVSFVVMLAGALIEFASFDVFAERFDSAGTLQSVYAGASLVIFVASWLVQRFVTPRVLNQRGVAAALVVLPVATAAGAAVLVIGGALMNVVVALVGLSLWRVVRRSLDASARQTAMATLPDERRTRSSFLIDLMPLSVGYLVFAPIAAFGLSLDLLWFAPVVALAFAVIAIVTSRRIIETWDTTQLSYRLKRRRRMG